MADPDPNLPDLEQAQIAALAAERAKHLAEASEFKRALWRRPGFWSALLPGAAAIFTAYIALTSQIFEVADDKAEARLERANAATERARAEKMLFDAETIETEIALAKAKEAFEITRNEFAEQTNRLTADFEMRQEDFRQKEEEFAVVLEKLAVQEEELKLREVELQNSIEALEHQLADQPLITALERFATAKDSNARREWFDTVERLFKAHQDPQQATKIAQEFADAHLDDFGTWVWIYSDIIEADQTPEGYAFLISQVELALAQPNLFGNDFYPLGYIGFTESMDQRANRCGLILKALAAENLAEPWYVFSALNTCVDDYGDPLPAALVADMAATSFERADALIEAEDLGFIGLYGYYAANVISQRDQHLAELMLAKSFAVSDFELSGYHRSLLEEYTQGQFGEIAKFGLATIDLAVWEQYWEDNKDSYDVEKMTVQLRGN